MTHQPSADAAAAALRGASLAFHKGRSPAPNIDNNSSSSSGNNNGALAAATMSAQSTGGGSTAVTGLPDIDSATARSIVIARLQQLGQQQQQQQQQQQAPQSHLHLQPHAHSRQQQHQQQHPSSKGAVDTKSPSFIAATLAASRNASPSPKTRSPRRKVSTGGMSAASSVGGAGGEVVDSGSIKPTGSLISMFEGAKTSAKKVEGEVLGRAVGNKVSRQPVVRPPTPSKPSVENRPSSDAPVKKQAPKGDLLPSSRPATGQASKRPTGQRRRSLTPPPPSPLKPAGIDTRARPAAPPVQKSDGTFRKSNVQLPRLETPPPPPRTAANKENLPTSNSTTTGELLGRKPSKPPKPAALPQSPPLPGVRRTQTEVLSPKPTRMARPQLPPPTPPQYPKTISRPSPQSPHFPSSPGDPLKKDTPKSQGRAQAPAPPKPRGTIRVTRPATTSSPRDDGARPRMTEAHRTLTGETSSTDEEFVSAPTSPESNSPPLPIRMQSTASPSSSSPTPRRLHARKPSRARSSQNLDLNSLTDAIMAGSLASSRLTPSHTGSSSLPPPPSLPPRQRSPRLRHTMRGPAQASDDEDGRHRKGHHHHRHRHKLRSGKHAHHEGSRKKWRDEIRPRERKRYEAVWASNRGALLPPPPSSSAQVTTTSGPVPASASSSSSISGVSNNQQPPPPPPRPIDYENSVANVIVRDIWRRSRLPEDELAEVWDLVDRDRRGVLGKQEFVVGMWLIDQRLRGRKIPTKVSSSVWGSANGVVRVVGPKAHGRK